MCTISQELTEISLRDTLDKKRCEAMGFTLEKSEVVWTGKDIVLKGRFKCVCGKYENFKFKFSVDPEMLDPAKLLRMKGAFSRDHLEEDGYTEEEICSILDKGTQYDMENRVY